MMSIPFFAGAIAILATWTGIRGPLSAWLVFLTIVATLVLFAFHATDSLDIAL